MAPGIKAERAKQEVLFLVLQSNLVAGLDDDRYDK